MFEKMMIMKPCTLLICLVSLLYLAHGNIVEDRASKSGSFNLRASWKKVFSGIFNEAKVKSAPEFRPSNGTDRKISLEDLKSRPFVVIQRRRDGLENFARPLHDYQVGFGHAQGDYWAGLDYIHKLTLSGYNILRIDLSDWSGNNRYALYSHFSINDHTDKYRMYLGGFSGTVVDDMSSQTGMIFSTFDYPDAHACATKQRAGWWYNYCAFALLNGHYYVGGPYSPHGSMYDGIYWNHWRGYGYSLKYVSMTLYK